MKNTYRIEVDCANCANKMELAAKNTDGVKDANVSFMTQKMTIDADDEGFDDILRAAQKAITRVDRACKIK